MFWRQSRSVIIDGDLKTIVVPGHLHVDPRLAPFGRVLQQVSDQLVEIAALPTENCVGVNFNLDGQSLVAVQPLQHPRDPLHGLANIRPGAEHFGLRRRLRALQVVCHIAGHRVGLSPNQIGQLVGPLGLVLQHGQWGLQRVRQIADMGTSTLHHLAVVRDQRVDLGDQRRQLGRILAIQIVTAPRANVSEIVLDRAQGTKSVLDKEDDAGHQPQAKHQQRETKT